MINRINSFNCFDDNEFLKIQLVVDKNKNNKKSKPIVSVGYKEAMSSGMFKRIGWGEYLYNGRIDDFSTKYKFDDGAIWRVEKDDAGNEFLVKEVDENNNLLRTASNEIYINSDNCKMAMNLLSIKSKDDLLSFILEDKNISNLIYNKINNVIKKYVQNYITDNKYIESKELLNDIMNVISRMLSTKEINDLDDLNNVIKTMCNKIEVVNDSFSFFEEEDKN